MKISYAVTAAAVLSLASSFASAQQTDGPPIKALSVVDENVWDVAHKTLVEKNSVVFLLTGREYERTIYRVSKYPSSDTKYMVEENASVTPVFVEQQATAPVKRVVPWKYVTK